ncbi:DUF7342 family protein [Halobellus ordinarius]|uniref:DUF7342 family protein n=1 Tax=Halobellus ordinarius TaxID=3075120 RepID=UPI002880B527|nr:hypothetical protein [Halobellus sp. ZY16]
MDDPGEFTETREVSSSDDPPDFTELDSPEAVLKDQPIRERLFDVILQVREPTKVSVIADRADCDTETARDYLDWFESIGIVQEYPGRPTQYERNDAYFEWRRVEQIRSTHSDEEIRVELTEVLDQLAEYRERFDAERPDDVSLVELSRDLSTEEAWEALSEWKTLHQRAELLDAARRDDGQSSGQAGRIDA